MEIVPGRLPAVSRVRHLEAAAGSPARISAGRRGHRGRRPHGRPLCRTCLIRSGMFQSYLNMPTRKSPDGRPQIAQVRPVAAIAGGEFTIQGKGFARTDRPRVTIGDVAAPVVIGSDSLVIARVPEGAAAGELVVASGNQLS